MLSECLKHGVAPVVIEEAKRNMYLAALKEYRMSKTVEKLTELFKKELSQIGERCAQDRTGEIADSCAASG